MAHHCIYSPNCPLTFSAPREALNHALAEHVRYKADPGYDFTCRIVNCACGGATFEKRDGIVTHLTLKANIYDVACERGCGRMFKRTSEMRTHLKKCQGGVGTNAPTRSRQSDGGSIVRPRVSDAGDAGGAATKRKSVGEASMLRKQQQQQETLPPPPPQQRSASPLRPSPPQQAPTAAAPTRPSPPYTYQPSPPRHSPPPASLPPPPHHAQQMSPPRPAPPSPHRNGILSPGGGHRTTLVVNGAGRPSASPSQSPATPSAVPVSSLINGPIPSSNPNSPKRTLASPLHHHHQPPPKKVRAWIGKIGKWVDMEVTEPS